MLLINVDLSKVILALVIVVCTVFTIVYAMSYENVVQGDLYLNKTWEIYKTSILVNGSVYCKYPDTLINITQAHVNITGRLICNIWNFSLSPSTVNNVTGTLTGILDDVKALDDVYLTVDAYNNTGTFITVLDINFTISSDYVNYSQYFENIQLVIAGNSSILPNTEASVSIYNYTSGSFVQIATLNSTSKVILNLTLNTLKDFVDNLGHVWIRINLTDTTNTPFKLGIDYVHLSFELKPNVNTLPLKLRTYEAYVELGQGGILRGALINIKHTHLVIKSGILTIVESNVSVSESIVEGNIVITNSTVQNLYSEFENLTCEGCLTESEMCKITYINTTLVKVKKHVEHKLTKETEIELEVETPGIEFELKLETPWCLDNMTVIVLPNGTVLQVNSCRPKLILKAITKTLKLLIYHGVYDEKHKILLHVGNVNATILNVSIMPKPEMICNVTVDAPKGTRSIIVLENVTKPARLFLNGTDVTAFYTTNISICNYTICWTYNSTAKEFIANVSHGSPVTLTSYSVAPSFKTELKLGQFSITISNPYDYDLPLTIKWYVYRFGQLIVTNSDYVIIHAHEEKTYTYSIPKFITSVKIEVYDTNDVKIYETELRTYMPYVLIVLPIIAIILIILLIFIRRGKAVLTSSEHRKMFKVM